MTRVKKKELILVIHNVRSALNVGSLFRTADGAGVAEIFLTGYTQAPPKKNAQVFTTAEKALKKTALGAEKSILWKKLVSLKKVIDTLRKTGFEIVALEQCEKSVDYLEYIPKSNVALIVGNEVRGVNAKVLGQCDTVVEIPMHGKKNSLNVSVAGGIALYRIRGTMERRSK